MNSNTKVKDLRPVDIYFNEYADNLKTTTQKFINGIGFSLMVFSALGMAWAIPFPYLKFLGQYNGFFNWASFLIAISIYYYYKLSPVLSYLILIVFFAFSCIRFTVILFIHTVQKHRPCMPFHQPNLRRHVG